MKKRISNLEEGEKLKKGFKIRVTRKVYAIIQRNAALEGVKISVFLRKRALNAQIKHNWVTEKKEVVAKILELSPLIHQLAERSKTEDIRIIAEEFKPLGEQIEMLHKQLLEIAGLRKV